MSLLLGCYDLGPHRASGAQAGGSSVDTTLCLCWLHLSFSCCVGCTPLKSSPPSISSSFLSSSWTVPSHLYYCPSSCASCSLSICSLHPHVSLLYILSFSSLLPSRLAGLFPRLFWQPSFGLIHGLVLVQCNQPLFVAHYQLPGAELFTAGQ